MGPRVIAAFTIPAAARIRPLGGITLDRRRGARLPAPAVLGTVGVEGVTRGDFRREGDGG
jgi:hypothetical protein